MPLTPEQIQIARQKYGIESPQEDVPTIAPEVKLNRVGKPTASSLIAGLKSQPGFGERVKSDFQERQQKIKDINASGFSTGSKLLQHGGQIAGGVGDIVFEGLKSLTPDSIEKPIGKVITGAARHILDTDTGKELRSKIENWTKEHPEASGNLGALLNIAGIIPEGKIVEMGLKGGLKAAKEGVAVGEDLAGLSKSIFTKNEAESRAFITKKFDKGVRPSTVGRETASDAKKYDDKAMSAVNTIIEHKPKLTYINDLGEESIGHAPTSLKEFSQAIQQTKKEIYNKYSALSSKATEGGAQVKLTPISDELNKIAKDPVVQDNSPSVAKYAQNKAETLAKREAYDPNQAEKAIELYNQSLQAFYRNPSYDTASKAAVDAMVANNMRKELDSTIEAALEKGGYQNLKNQYGALKSIEKDVIKRAEVDGRKNIKGLIDFTDIFTAGQVMRGIMTGNMVDFATGGVQTALKSYFKFLNDPNNAIKGMFQEAEKLGTRATKPTFTPKSEIGKFVKNPKFGLSIEDVSGGKNNILSLKKQLQDIEKREMKSGLSLAEKDDLFVKKGEIQNKIHSLKEPTQPSLFDK